MMEQSPDSGQAGAPEGKIEVTPAMVRAAYFILWEFEHEEDSVEDSVTRIYRAMESARERPEQTKLRP